MMTTHEARDRARRLGVSMTVTPLEERGHQGAVAELRVVVCSEHWLAHRVALEIAAVLPGRSLALDEEGYILLQLVDLSAVTVDQLDASVRDLAGTAAALRRRLMPAGREVTRCFDAYAV